MCVLYLIASLVAQIYFMYEVQRLQSKFYMAESWTFFWSSVAILYIVDFSIWLLFLFIVSSYDFLSRELFNEGCSPCIIVCVYFVCSLQMKTGCVALVLCLNISVDPPDVIKISPCARLECWIGIIFSLLSYLKLCLLCDSLLWFIFICLILLNISHFFLYEVLLKFYSGGFSSPCYCKRLNPVLIHEQWTNVIIKAFVLYTLVEVCSYSWVILLNKFFMNWEV